MHNKELLDTLIREVISKHHISNVSIDTPQVTKRYNILAIRSFKRANEWRKRKLIYQSGQFLTSRPVGSLPARLKTKIKFNLEFVHTRPHILYGFLKFLFP